MSQRGASVADVQSAIIALKNKTGPHFNDPWLLTPLSAVAASANMYDAGGTSRALNTTAAFTGFAQMGIQDVTDWAANTYKTVYAHTGKGLIWGLIACTAGGAETTTFEITIDGVLAPTITVANANGERAVLMASGGNSTTDYTTANNFLPNNYSFDSSTLTTGQGFTNYLPSVRTMLNLGVPALRYDISCLIRMKHSAIITNSTATAYSAVLVRKGITA